MLALGTGLLYFGFVVHPFVHTPIQGRPYYQPAGTFNMLFVALFRRWFDLAHPAVRTVSDASHTTYLVHHIVVIAIATLLLGLAAPCGYWNRWCWSWRRQRC